MPVRPQSSLILAEIDNSVRGRITGFLWFAGREDPVRLELTGDACPDLAGSRVVITNPDPRPDAAALTLDSLQTGRAGDFTLSWRRGLPPELAEEGVPGSVLLEWFSETDGRVVMESAAWNADVSGHEWSPTDEEEAERQRLIMHAMRDHIRRVISRPSAPPSDSDITDPDDISEEVWERSLKESDRLTDASMEVHDKYGDDPDFDLREAWLMGWDESAEYSPDNDGGTSDEMEDGYTSFEWENEEDDEEDFPGDADTGDDADDSRKHPLHDRAVGFLTMVMDYYEERGIEEIENETDPGPAAVFINSVMQISGKLAGALGGWYQYRLPRGMILAVTRRCLQWANEALAALSEMENSAPDPGFATLRSGLFALREEITDLRRELQAENRK